MSSKLVFYCFILFVFPFTISFTEENVKIDNSIEKQLARQVNNYRNKNGLERLKNDTCLYKAALNHAFYLVTQDKLSHFQKSKKTKSPVERANMYDCKFDIILENIALISYTDEISSNESSERLINLWINSKGHKINLINKNVDKSGLAVINDFKNRRIIAVQVFSK